MRLPAGLLLFLIAQLFQCSEQSTWLAYAPIIEDVPHGKVPIGVFWDIENCQVPRGKSATALVGRIRELFFGGHVEAEFLCVCDIRKELPEVVHELNLAQVTVVHINAVSKNAADDKLKQCMRRFVDIHGSPATLVLISGDVNFSTDLSDFRHRRQIRVLLLHGGSAPEALTACAHDSYSFVELASELPFRTSRRDGLCDSPLDGGYTVKTVTFLAFLEIWEPKEV
ncbi:meiosis regulator and mRNA stability factor 1-like [Rhipicephalus sanguineus]|uniref:meiosis regulator and mRNA stability factor 1-like n=1 Tax=Rhipicephalus sanguineus TaxID=34632 RepID=UPI0020C1C773|nr:meiosis regulator and mRNA stability factor 1-like [Rhipicephalus sanguineus]